MKLWLIIYTASRIGGFAGPLPYEMDECLIRRDELRADQADSLERSWHKTEDRPATADEMAGLRSITFECEWRDVRPELGAPK